GEAEGHAELAHEHRRPSPEEGRTDLAKTEVEVLYDAREDRKVGEAGGEGCKAAEPAAKLRDVPGPHQVAVVGRRGCRQRGKRVGERGRTVFVVFHVRAMCGSGLGPVIHIIWGRTQSSRAWAHEQRGREASRLRREAHCLLWSATLELMRTKSL